MEYKSKYECAMTLKPYRDLINSFDTAKREGAKQVKMEIAQKMLAMGLDIESIAKATGLTEDMILR
jgi:predicted transposase/invertase (TIGR01784 family)